MLTLFRALSAETLKTKRTLALLLTFLAPLAVVALQTIMLHQRGIEWLKGVEHKWFWFAEQVTIFWSLLMLPLFITLQTSLLAQIEHNQHAWKQLFAQPLPRSAIYFAKQLVAMLLIGLSIVLLYVFTGVSGLIVDALVPELQLGRIIPWGDFARMALLLYLSSWLLISFHTWVALRWPSFVVASTVGIIATVCGIVISNSDQWSKLYPWTMPAMLVYQYCEQGTLWWGLLAVGCLGGVVAALFGAWDVTDRDIL